MGTLIAGPKSFKARSHKRSGSRLAGLPKLDDLSSDHLTKRIGAVGGGAERRKSHLESNAQETDGLGVELMPIQICLDRHVTALVADVFFLQKKFRRKVVARAATSELCDALSLVSVVRNARRVRSVEKARDHCVPAL